MDKWDRWNYLLRTYINNTSIQVHNEYSTSQYYPALGNRRDDKE
jgi:hypothetical protein